MFHFLFIVFLFKINKNFSFLFFQNTVMLLQTKQIISSKKQRTKTSHKKLVRKNEIVRNKNSRLKKKVKKLQDVLETVKNKMNPETFLEASENANKIPEHLLNTYHQKINNGKNQLKFDDTIRIFALSLHLKSASAYRYARKSTSKRVNFKKMVL